MKQVFYAVLTEVVFWSSKVDHLPIPVSVKTSFILEGWSFEGFWSWKVHHWIRRDSRILTISFLWISDKYHRSYVSLIFKGWSSDLVSSRSFKFNFVYITSFLFVHLSTLFTHLSLLTGTCHFLTGSCHFSVGTAFEVFARHSNQL